MWFSRNTGPSGAIPTWWRGFSLYVTSYFPGSFLFNFHRIHFTPYRTSFITAGIHWGGGWGTHDQAQSDFQILWVGHHRRPRTSFICSIDSWPNCSRYQLFSQTCSSSLTVQSLWRWRTNPRRGRLWLVLFVMVSLNVKLLLIYMATYYSMHAGQDTTEWEFYFSNIWRKELWALYRVEKVWWLWGILGIYFGEKYFEVYCRLLMMIEKNSHWYTCW